MAADERTQRIQENLDKVEQALNAMEQSLNETQAMIREAGYDPPADSEHRRRAARMARHPRRRA